MKLEIENFNIKLKNGKVLKARELEVSLRESREVEKGSRVVEKKIARLEASLLETQEQVEQSQTDVIDAQNEAALAQKQAAKLERQIEKLQIALDTEKARYAAAIKAEKNRERNSSKPPSKTRATPSVIERELEESGNELHERPSRTRKPESTRSEPDTKGNRKGKEKASEVSEDIPQRTKDKRKDKERTIEREVVEIEDDELYLEDGEIQEVPPPTKKHSQGQDSDVEKIPPPGKKPQSKIIQTDGSKEETTNAPPRLGKTKGVDAEDDERPRKRSRSKPPSTSGSQNLQDVDTGDEPVKKKKRKLNVTNGAGIFGGPAGFSWNQDGDGDLGIPSILSPVKEGEPVPVRSGSTSGSFFNAWKR
ncbi:hypothetical protein K439DRAFT_697427 [Ramaria rubella]|nr:hypothetical protein K439DRAFT_697427 [Ramaria rubella]